MRLNFRAVALNPRRGRHGNAGGRRACRERLEPPPYASKKPHRTRPPARPGRWPAPPAAPSAAFSAPVADALLLTRTRRPRNACRPAGEPSAAQPTATWPAARAASACRAKGLRRRRLASPQDVHGEAGAGRGAGTGAARPRTDGPGVPRRPKGRTSALLPHPPLKPSTSQVQRRKPRTTECGLRRRGMVTAHRLGKGRTATAWPR